MSHADFLGHNALRQMHHQVQEPLMNAMSGQGQGAAGSRSELAARAENPFIALLQPPVAPEQQQQQGGQEGMLSGLQRIEEAKLLSRKAEAALVLVGGGSANALQLQRNTLESLDAAEQMQELEMQKEALELEEKESQLLKESP